MTQFKYIKIKFDGRKTTLQEFDEKLTSTYYRKRERESAIHLSALVGMVNKNIE